MHALPCSSNAIQSWCSRPATTAVAAAQLWRWGHTASRQLSRGALLATRALPQVKVVGVGGSATRMVGQLWDNEALSNLDLEWLIINTDVQEMTSTWLPDQDKLLIGASTTKWAGAQGNHLMGQAAAEESTGDITKALQGADLVLLLAGMGGGTGRGAAPVVADVARRQGACTISIAMVPEQQGMIQSINLALAGLQAVADAAVAVSCEDSSTHGPGPDAQQLPVTCLVQGVADLLLGFDPADLEDVQSAVAGGCSTLSFAVAQGYGSVTRAVFAAMSTRECLPVLQQASGVLCFVAGADDISECQLADVQEVLSSQCSSAHTLLVRAVQSDLPPGSVAATVLITTPAQIPPGTMDETTEEKEEEEANQSPEASAGESANGTVRHLADVADASGPLSDDLPDAAADEEQQQRAHEEVPPGQDQPCEGNSN